MTIDPELKKRFEEWDTNPKLGANICSETARFLLAELERIKAGKWTYQDGPSQEWRLNKFEERINQFIALCTEAQNA